MRQQDAAIQSKSTVAQMPNEVYNESNTPADEFVGDSGHTYTMPQASALAAIPDTALVRAAQGTAATRIELGLTGSTWRALTNAGLVSNGTVNPTAVTDELARRERAMNNPAAETGAIIAYKSSESYKINDALLNGEELSESDKSFVEQLDKELKQVPKYSGKVYRNLTFDHKGKAALDAFVAQHAEGAVVTYPAYTSTSKIPDGYTVEGEYTAHLEIYGENGRDIADGYGDSSEQEVLYERNSDFVVKSISYDGKTANIVMEEFGYGKRRVYSGTEGDFGIQQELNTGGTLTDLQSVSTPGEVGDILHDISRGTAESNPARGNGVQRLSEKRVTDTAFVNTTDTDSGSTNNTREVANNGTEHKQRNNLQRQRGAGNVSPSTGEPTGRVSQGTEAVRRRWKLNGAPKDTESASFRFTEKVKAKTLVPQAAENSTVYMMDKNSAESAKKANALAKKNGVSLSLWGGGEIGLTSGDTVRGFAIAGSNKIGVQADNPDVLGDDIARHEIMEQKILNGEIDVDEVLDKATEIIGEDAISAAIGIYEAGNPKAGRKNAKRELVCDGADHINQMQSHVDRGETMYQPLAELLDDVIGAINTVANEMTDNAFELTEEELASLTEDSNDVAVDDSNQGTEARYSFAGPKAKTANISLLELAKKLRKNGVSKETIFERTGWLFGKDGEWRFEIDDSKAELRPLNPNVRKTTLGEIFKHNDLYKAYPFLKNTVVEFVNFGDSNLDPGRVVGDRIQISDMFFNENASQAECKQTFIHEIQHLIQDYENFAQGGTPQSAMGIIRREAEFYLAENDERFNKIVAEGTFGELSEYVDNFLRQEFGENNLDKIADMAYYMLHGEREAYLAESRVNMTESERRANYPDYGEVILGEGSVEKSRAVLPEAHSDFVDSLIQKMALQSRNQEVNKEIRDTKEKVTDKRPENSGDIRKSRKVELNDDVKAALEELMQEYGIIPKGESAFRDVSVPKKTAEDKNVSQTVRTVLEAAATPDTIVPDIEKLIAKGDFSYDTYTDKQAIDDAQAKIKHLGWEQALMDWTNKVKEGNVSKENTAMGWALYDNAANEGKTSVALDILDLMIGHQRNAAQAVQATRILKKMNPETQLYGIKKSVDRLQEEINERYGEKKAPKPHIFIFVFSIVGAILNVQCSMIVNRCAR